MNSKTFNFYDTKTFYNYEIEAQVDCDAAIDAAWEKYYTDCEVIGYEQARVAFNKAVAAAKAKYRSR